MPYFCRSKKAVQKALKSEVQQEQSQILKKGMTQILESTKTQFSPIRQADYFSKFQNVRFEESLLFSHSEDGLPH